MKKLPTTILFENDGLLTGATQRWATAIDKNYQEINSSGRDYMRSNDLFFFGLLINPDLKRVITSSGFVSNMPYGAILSFRKNDDDVESFKQLEYFAWLFYEAVAYRKRYGMQPIVIDINYMGHDFLDDLKRGQFGEDTTTYLKLMLRQSEGHVTINLYEDYEMYRELKTEEDLGL